MKLGIHAQRLTDAVKEYAKVVPAMKSVGDISVLTYARKVNPGVFTVFRPWWEDQEAALRRGGRNCAIEAVAQLQGFRPDCVEGFNEFRQFWWEGFDEYIVWNMEYGQALADYGLPFSMPQNSVGCPNKEEIHLMARNDFCGAEYWNNHEYWGWDYKEPWTALRHRIARGWMREIKCEDDLPPLLITECGCDNVYGAGDGWKAQGKTPERYRDELVDWNRELEKDSYVKYAFIFTAGPYGWQTFDIDGITEVLLPIWKEGATDMIPFRLGFAEYALRNDVGYAIEELQYDLYGNGWQHTSKGLLFWYKKENKIIFYPA